MADNGSMKRRPDTLKMGRNALWGISIVIVIGFLLLGFHYQRTFKAMEEFTLSTMLKNAGQTGLNISNTLNNVDNLSMFFLRNSTVHHILTRPSEDNSLDQQLDDFKTLKTLAEVVYEGRSVYAFRIFLSGENIYSREGISFFDIGMIDHTGMGAVLRDNPNLLTQNGWTGLYRETYLDKPPANVVSYIRCLRDESDYNKIIAIIALDVLGERFSQVLAPIAEDDAIIRLVNREGQILAAVPSESTGDMLTLSETDSKALHVAESGVFQEQRDDAAWYVIHHRVPESDWQVVISIPTLAIRQGNSLHTMLIGIILIFAVVFLVVCIMLIVFSLVTRTILKNIQDIANQVEDGHFEFIPSQRSKDRYLNQIESYIGKITSSVRELEKQNYLGSIKERDYHLKALQAQINPHFLYNTLDTIKWMSVKHNASEIEDLTTSLAKYFRLSLNKGRDIVQLADEIELVSTYMYIQQVRFDHPIVWNCNVDEDVYVCLLPKLTIQPIIENALLHGIRNGESGTGSISLFAHRDGSIVAIQIKDNGVGMTKEELETLLVDSPERKGYGMHNVQERIQLMYGQDYGLTIDSSPGEGTVVTVRIPFERS